MRAIRYEKDAVLIKDGKIKAWVDIWIEDEDVICDWNQNIFWKTDEEDMTLKKWQDNLENFQDATSLAIRTLIQKNIIIEFENSFHI